MAAVVISLGAWWIENAEAIPFDAIVLGAIILLNAVIGHVQGARAEQAAAALQAMAAPTALLVRDGGGGREPGHSR